ncbi:MAG: hypothetical protein CL927_07280 [Deltaproteobacteria bacterium]|nr:hypothetical protein [Deltaproteobacteria bacterium]
MAATGLAYWVAGAEMGGGVAASGGLILVNFALWQRVGHAFFAAALQGTSSILAVALWSLKLVLLFGGLLFLLATFSPLAVAVGSSVIVASILLQALGSTASELRLEGTR